MSLDMLPPSSLKVSSQADTLLPSARVIQLPLVYPCWTRLHVVDMDAQFPPNQKERKQSIKMQNDEGTSPIASNIIN